MGFQSLPGAATSMVDHYISPTPGMDGFSRHGTSSSSSQSSYFGSAAPSPVIYQQSGGHGFQNSRAYTDMESNRPMPQATPVDYQTYYAQPANSSRHRRYSSASIAQAPIGRPHRHVSVHSEWDTAARISPDVYMHDVDSPRSYETREYVVETSKSRHGDKASKTGSVKYHSQRRPSNRDEFDGPHQLLEPPSPKTIAAQERELPTLPTNLDVSEQDRILCEVNDRLSRCAFDFVAKYQFPIPIEPDKRQVRVPADREWTEWVYLLKRLATKRRIPARLVTVLENSLEMRHAAKHQSRPVKDDRNVLQLVSAGTQVAKILKDATAMEYLDRLYQETERRIKERQNRRVKFAS
ncbi:conserved hypothetical protein [Talaromyces stipitatus ATCC 10500]|uniref:Uncharacterized protein n=1 Tax=Talaromyces stipitatus (strain ATCC 10500 / CBS 375.48 / QM 6759 / NRRL 1006) TaxID=441959 RepID=B8MGT3_TALSN|nr:uncharacterized protein TSTA_014110 [Talaromyces stipitatus ATCC 10500]EED16314.1 conserved hypothetical protein [Talaromyces stipitatus ATCC 10500]